MAAGDLCVAKICQSFGGILMDRLEHPEAFVRLADEALVNQGLERVEVGLGDLFSRVERAAPGES